MSIIVARQSMLIPPTSRASLVAVYPHAALVSLIGRLSGPIFPTTGPQTINGVTYTGLTCTAAAPCSLPAVDPNFRDPYSAQWNLDIQRAITSNLTVDVAYVGNKGYDEQTRYGP